MPKIKVKGQRFKQESAHRKTDGHTDATKRIIAPATRSIKKKEIMEGKIYSPVGRFVERAKKSNGQQPTDYDVSSAAFSKVQLSYYFALSRKNHTLVQLTSIRRLQ